MKISPSKGFFFIMGQEVEQAKNVHVVRYKYDSGQKFNHLFISDIHFDSKDCQRELLKKHLDRIKEVDGKVFIIGDLFDVMGTFRDPRSKGQDVRPEYLSQERGYLDLVVEDCYQFLLPYKDHIEFISPGNHETNIHKRHDTDIINRLVFLLNTAGANVHYGGYGGYIRFNFTYAKNAGSRKSYKVAYHHGYGGSAKRSKGVLNAQIDGFVFPDADMIVSGHTHGKIHDPSNVRYRLTDSNRIEQVCQHWIKLGSYKSNYKNPLIGGWTVEKGFLPTKLGGFYVNLTASCPGGRPKVETEVIEAC